MITKIKEIHEYSEFITDEIGVEHHVRAVLTIDFESGTYKIEPKTFDLFNGVSDEVRATAQIEAVKILTEIAHHKLSGKSNLFSKRKSFSERVRESLAKKIVEKYNDK